MISFQTEAVDEGLGNGQHGHARTGEMGRHGLRLPGVKRGVGAAIEFLFHPRQKRLAQRGQISYHRPVVGTHEQAPGRHRLSVRPAREVHQLDLQPHLRVIDAPHHTVHRDTRRPQIGEIPARARRATIAGDHIRHPLAAHIPAQVLLRLFHRRLRVRDQDEAARCLVRPLRVHLQYRMPRRPRPREEIQDQITRVRRDLQDALDQAR